MSPQRYENDGDVDTRRLSEPLRFYFSGRTMRNRLFKASMGETLGLWDSSDVASSGVPSKEIIELYRRWGEQDNGFGMILTGNIQVSTSAPHLQGDLMIDASHPFHGPRFEAFKRLAEAGKANSSLMVAQVSYPGRQALAAIARKAVIAPSVVPYATDAQNATFAQTREATPADIEYLTQSFVHAAEYLEAAGFDGIELHGAHGYVLAQFLSPRTNKRSDDYGGSLTNRMRILIGIAREIRTRTSQSFILGVKLNSVEFQEGGFTADEAAIVANALQDVGVDFVELSGGTLEKVGHEWTKETTLRREAFFLKFAEMIVPQLGSARTTKVFVTGGLRSVAAMTRALETVDAVGMARPAAQEPWIAGNMLAGTTTGVVKPVAPFDNDSILSNAVAGAQLRQIADGKMPFDASDEVVLETFGKDKEEHDRLAAEDDEKKRPWFARYTGAETVYNGAGW